jgi:hypothetical protein
MDRMAPPAIIGAAARFVARFVAPFRNLLVRRG